MVSCPYRRRTAKRPSLQMAQTRPASPSKELSGRSHGSLGPSVGEGAGVHFANLRVTRTRINRGGELRRRCARLVCLRGQVRDRCLLGLVSTAAPTNETIRSSALAMLSLELRRRFRTPHIYETFRTSYGFCVSPAPREFLTGGWSIRTEVASSWSQKLTRAPSCIVRAVAWVS